MKARHWEKMQERQLPGIILDQDDFDVRYWELDINVTDISGQTISGEVTMTSESVVDGLTEVDYDYHQDMLVDYVEMDGEPVSYDHNGDALVITLNRSYNAGEQFTTVIGYNGHPAG
ncbi:MAG: hypothetical protein V3S06_04990, partial [candidate division Zixibacteria bacterium]